VKSAANKYQLPALLLNKSINLKYKGITEMGIINGTDSNDNGLGLNAKPQLVGSNEADIIDGKAGDDVLWGLGGHDVLYGGSGWDELYGGSGNDKLYSEGDGGWMFGGSGNDILTGGTGFDYLDGASDGTGNGIASGTEFDTLTGGVGGDRFVLGDFSGVYYLGNGHATITDFSLAQGDIIQIKGNFADGYSLKLGNWGGAAKQDTGILFKGNLIGVVQDQNITNLSPDKVFAPPFPPIT
jgi:Ca2+-binding RTX toxin-like protein